eukprot:CAMPEP_0176381638 /NCGR_PEP_ID=MMETSP0126-20121128/32040_1 /TAXON_ID=141414 ORGANISM="Strombidinopsis acuminatum, Strain SPMC142" /NCGR_SAMPLE_ID=MMETSP0126 /ASSEMBLY_ACC=CAM_ASM_000229 /LENGTH=226 /DNA_ID=CAMNT_0017745579 /DNA_START=264 /DNA_END=944 /DNA_ORIENTATION=-
MEGGELFDRIVEKENYSEKEASETIRPIVDCIKYCHDIGLIHRDLKPENLLYESEEEKSIIKVSDFGVARFVQNELATTACGTPSYLAPEMTIGGGYGKEVDMWSIGIIIYIMLCGFPPFYSDNNQELFKMIQSGQYDFPSPYWDDVSESAKELVKSLLQVDPKQRLTADQVLMHPWILGSGNNNLHMADVQEKLKEFNAMRRLKRAGQIVIAVNRLQNLVKSKFK